MSAPITTIEEGFQNAKETPSNVNEHITVLADYSEKCTSVAELGVNEMISTWAFIKGLRFNKKKKKHIVCVDIAGKPKQFDEISALAKKNKITMEFLEGDSGTVDLPRVDMLFIDTMHHYAQLMKELEKHHSRVKKYIVMHNTEVDSVYGEVVRMCYYYNVKQMQEKFGYSVKDMCKGLKPAIDDFVAKHPEWRVEKVFKNNNGMTILSRVDDHEEHDE
jgi:hypothetical protein